MVPQNDHGVETVSALHRRYPARIEVEPEAVSVPRYPNLVRTLRDPVSICLVVGACIAQVADTVTTSVALAGGQFVERNGLLRAAVTQPLEVGALKLLLILLVCLLVMLRLPTRFARLALLLAFGLSAFAPVQNSIQLFLHH